MKLSQMIKDITDWYNPDDEVAYSLWTLEDIREQCRQDEIELTEDEMKEVLDELGARLVNLNDAVWEIISSEADNIIKNRKK